MSHAIFVIVAVSFRIFSKLNDFHSMNSVGKPVAFMKQDQKKDGVAQADLSVPPCSKNVHNVQNQENIYSFDKTL